MVIDCSWNDVSKASFWLVSLHSLNINRFHHLHCFTLLNIIIHGIITTGKWHFKTPCPYPITTIVMHSYLQSLKEEKVSVYVYENNKKIKKKRKKKEGCAYISLRNMWCKIGFLAITLLFSFSLLANHLIWISMSVNLTRYMFHPSEYISRHHPKQSIICT